MESETRSNKRRRKLRKREEKNKTVSECMN
jgi:hypothetical protein